MAVTEAALLKNKTTAAGGGSGYQITKSLQFNNVDNTTIQRTPPTKGSTRAWTISVWVKRALADVNDRIFMAGDTSDETGLRFDQDNLHLYRYNGSYQWRVESTPFFRDSSAWYHIVGVYNSNTPIAADRLQLYVNGRRLAVAGNASYPAQYAESTINTAIKHNFGKLSNSTSTASFDGLLAEPIFIDGLVLGPEAFAEVDSNTGVWNPKAFALPTVNDGTTWSSNFTGDLIDGTHVAARAFNGDLTTYLQSNGNNATIHWGGSSNLGITYNSRIRANVYFNGTFKINDDKVVSCTGGAQNWVTLVEGESGTLDKLTITSKDNHKIDLRAIEIDGVILVDGKTDPDTRNNPNNNTTWSSYATSSTGSFYGSMPVTQLFDGHKNTATDISANTAGGTLTFEPPSSIPTNTNSIVEIEASGNATLGNASCVVTHTDNSTTSTTNIGGANTKTIYTGNKGVKKIVITYNGAWLNLAHIRIDGHVLVDSTVDNSFHLKFDDTGVNEAFGYSSLPANVNDPNKSGPILKTSSTSSGRTLTSGTNTDANASSIVLAIPCNSATDVHHTVKGSGSAKTITYTSGAVASTERSIYYGTSTYVDGSGARVVSSQTNDCTFAGQFTVEGWFHLKGGTNNMVIMWSGGTSGDGTGQGRYLLWTPSNNLTLVVYDGSNGTTPTSRIASSTTLEENRWYHAAITRDSNHLVTLYLDGVSQGTWDSENFWTGSDTHSMGGQNNTGAPELGSQGGSNNMTGYLQDWRWYTTCKYTGRFSPQAATNFPFISNLEHRISASGDTNYVSGTTLGTTTLGYSYMFPNIFDGSITTEYVDRPNNNNYVNFSNLPTASSSVQVYAWAQSGTLWYKKDGGSVTNFTSSAKQWHDLGTGKIIQLGCDGGSGSDGFSIYAIKVDGTILTYYPPKSCDSRVDTPTNYGEDSDGKGGIVRGNYCTLNHLNRKDNSGSNTLKWSNLYAEGTSSSGAWHKIRSTMAIPKGNAGKWYYEVEIENSGSGIGYDIGWENVVQHINYAGGIGDSGKDGWCYKSDGNKRHNGSASSYGDTYSTGNVIGVGYNNGALYFWKNGTAQNSGTAAFTGVNADLCPTIALYSESNTVPKAHINFGQYPFQHPQSGYNSLCAQNLPDLFDGEDEGVVNNPSKFFDIRLITSTNTNDRRLKGWGFGPDLVWAKSRNQTYNHKVYDVLRGTNNSLYANSNDSENTSSNQLSAFRDDGFDLGQNSNVEYDTGNTGVIWGWDAGTGVTNYGATDNGADIACAVWKNTTAGFSIVKWTSDAGSSNSFMNHGLGTHLNFVLIKNVTSNSNWFVLHDGLGTSTNDIRENHMVLNTNAGYVDKGSEYFERASNNVFGLRHDVISSSSSDEMIAYCWATKPGYSAFGKYVGADNNFIYTGFAPRWIMIKNIDTAGEEWLMFDSERSPFNNNILFIKAENTAAESSYGGRYLALHSNGFYFPSTSEMAPLNAPNANYLYTCFAEHPFKIARAR